MTKIVIIGGGPAGYEAALAAAAYGADITVIDSDGVGGACVLWDCVPSKTFIASTGIRTEVRRAVDLGINLSTDDALVTLPQIHQRVRDLAFAQSADIRSRLISEGVKLVSARAALEERQIGVSTHGVVATLPDGSTERYEGDVVLV
ncbi:MAG: FAD-dependent oxidoreductase, partial [Mycobacterium sp.]|nr:FAD-dependent oxidoreductase [Mycobacterium sp.]